MTCQEVMELIQRELDRDLHKSEHELLSVHLQQCPECAEMFEKLNKLSTELEQLPKVTPPVNLVDAILPQLEEIDRLGIATIADLPASRRNGRKRFFQRGSFAVISGVAAAGIVLGLFMVQYNFDQYKVADDSKLMNQSRANKQNESSAKREISSADQKSKADETGAGSNNNAIRPQTSDQEAKGSIDAIDTPSTLKTPLNPTSQESTTDNKSTTIPKKSPENSGQSVNTEGVSNSEETESPEQSAQLFTAAPSQSDQSSEKTAQKSGQSSDGSAEQQSVQESSDAANKSAEQPSREVAQAPMSKSAPAPEKSGEPQYGINGIESTERQSRSTEPDAPKMQLRGFTPPVQTAPELETADKIYKATVEQQKVLIWKNGKVVFTSQIQWDASVNLKLLSWESNTKLHYDAVISAQSIKHMMINVQTGTEVVIQN